MVDICNDCAHKEVCKYADTLKTYTKCINECLVEHKLEPYGHFEISMHCDLFNDRATAWITLGAK